MHRALSEKVMLDLGGRLRYVTHVVDPGDAFTTGEVILGVSYLFGH